jgi:hypothetical protein
MAEICAENVYRLNTVTISLCSVGAATGHGFLLIDFVPQQKSIKCNSLLILISHDSSSAEGEAGAAS